MQSEKDVLSSLANEYWEIACHPQNVENAKLYRAVNGLKMIRPVVLIEEEPWSELNINGELDLLCSDSDFRKAEFYMRKVLYKWHHHPADMIIPPYIPVGKIIGGKSGWLTVKEDTIAVDNSNNIISHEYVDQLANSEDINKLQMPELSYEKVATIAIQDKLNEVIGNIIPARITGYSAYFSPWDTIAQYRGATNILIDLLERSEHTHAIMEKMTSMLIEQNRQDEELGLFEGNAYQIHCTAGLCDELKTNDAEPVLCKNIWGRSMAQILSAVSSDMHEEFEIEYQKKLLAPFGLTYYGCCEPLDKKIDIVKKLPHLRKISITPWADVNVAAEAIGKDYVLSSKPNPANVGIGFDKKIIKKEITTILDACYKNGCSCDIVLKDISTVAHNPKNLELWEKTVMDIIKSY